MELEGQLQVAAGLMVSEQVSWREAVKRLKKAVLLKTLEATGGNQCRAARRLQMHRNTVSRVMKETA